MAIIDKRKQKRTITIKFEKEGYNSDLYNSDLDELVNNIAKKIETICYPKDLSKKVNIKIEIN